MNTPLFLLRVIQVGLKLSDLDHLNFGDVMDILAESANDSYNYRQLATQADFDKF